MHIESVAIANYKSFAKKQSIHFEPGFNLLLGSNNAGKTTVLEVIDIDPNLQEPHRSERTIPQYGGQQNTASELEVTLVTRFSELWQLTGASQVYLPLIGTQHVRGFEVIDAIALLIKNDDDFKITSSFGHGLETLTFSDGDLVSGVVSRNVNNPVLSALIQRTSDGEYRIEKGNYSGVHGNVGNYAQQYKPRIYRFGAQRRPGYACGAQTLTTLDREAVSLPYCINHLQTIDAHGHKTLCAWVNRVFPSVKWVQAPPNVNTFEIRCLPHLPEARRDDLAIPLARMGAGIGNVIAMLYVVLTAREPQVIAIDEPNAFLHPRALRELLAILETEGKQHQFILTAHSADVLTAVNTKTISLLEFDGVATSVHRVGPKDIHLLRSNLAELGIRMTDLHAKDRVFWVEGQTEELVMPELLRWACPEIAAGTSVLRVERTGTFDKKSIEPEEVASIYERLSSSSALVPPMVCILLDGESRSKAKRLQIETASQGKLRFLDRRMLENYLLHPGAMTAAISELGVTTNLEMVRNALSRETSPNDFNDLDGAAILKAIFSTVSDTRLEFRKTRDVPVLVSWLLENDPEYLKPLGDCLRRSFGI